MSSEVKPKPRPKFIPPSKNLKAKVGNGGLSENILEKAQTLIESNTVDFVPLAEMYLETLDTNIQKARREAQDSDYVKESAINILLHPIIKLKSNAGMFKYQLISDIADHVIRFLETIDTIDADVLEIIQAFHAAIRVIVVSRLDGGGGEQGRELTKAIHEACLRYLDKNPENREAPV